MSVYNKSSLGVQMHLTKKLAVLSKLVSELCRRTRNFISELKSIYFKIGKAAHM